MILSPAGESLPPMGDRSALLSRLEAAITADPARADIFRGGAGPEWARVLVEKIRRHAYRVTDEEIAAVAKAHGDDAVFEVIVAAAGWAAKLRRDAALKALEDAK